jgi:hypothetical protein
VADTTSTGAVRPFRFGVVAPLRTDLPTWRDRLTSNMTNALMRNLGMPGRQSPQDVMRVRTAMRSGGGAGTWQAGEEPPEGH